MGGRGLRVCLTDMRCHEPAVWPASLCLHDASDVTDVTAYHWRGQSRAQDSVPSLSNHSLRPIQRSLEAPRREDAPCVGTPWPQEIVLR